jgi:hypothetical protein
MPEKYKGVPEYYEVALSELWGTNFFEWKNDDPRNLEPGQICQTVISYQKDDMWFLSEEVPSPKNETDTLWKINKLEQTRLPEKSHRLHDLNLESNEHLVIKRAKLRFVILISQVHDEWWNPRNESYHERNWFVMPLFTYKDNKHTRSLVIEDQKLNTPNRFYIPPSPQERFKESCIRLSTIQEVPGIDLLLTRAHNPDPNVHMQKALKISHFALKLITYHFFKSLNILDDLSDKGAFDDEYKVFKDVIEDLFKSSAE